MSTLATEVQAPRIETVEVSDDGLSVELLDGRRITVPLAWYPRLVAATRAELESWRILGGGEGVHWPELDEDVSAENLVRGQPSGESQESLRRWLADRDDP